MRQRLFFALWPGEKQQRQWARAAKGWLADLDGRFVPRRNLHLTLVFLGDVAVERRRCILAAADRVSVEPFSITLTRIGYWRRSRVVWLGPEQTPMELLSLVEQLNAGLAACGFPADGVPYRPHVTLLRKARRAPAEVAFDPVVWPVERFVLVESHLCAHGPRYEILRQWSLG